MSTQPLTAFRNGPPAVCMTIDDGDPGTGQTVGVMRNLIHQGRKDPFINRLAIWIVRKAGVREYDFAGERRAIFNWMHKNIRFIRDIADMETPRTARETVEVGAGDCDCMTVLMCSLLATIGNQVRIITVETRPGDAEFSHVYAEVLDGNRWVAVDTARPGARFGRGPEQYRRKWAWDVFSNYVQELGGSNANAQWNQFAPGAGVGRMGLAGYVALSNPIRAMAPGRRGMNGLARSTGGGGVIDTYRQMNGLGRSAGGGGVINFRNRRMGRLGDDIDWGGIAQAATAIGNSTTNIINATNNPYLSNPYLNQNALMQQQALLQQQQQLQNPLGGSVNIGGMLISAPMLLIGAVILVALAEKK